MKKLITMAIVLVSALAVYSVTVSTMKIGVFNPSQARVLNAAFGEVETAINAAVTVDTNATTTVTNYTPTAIGQLLTGGAGAGTNAMWVAEGLTTGSWVQVSSYTE